MSFPSYSNYKDTGIPWVGCVPVEWQSWKIRHAFGSIGSGTTPPSDEQKWYVDGTIPWVTTGELRERLVHATTKFVTELAVESFSSLKVHPAGSLVIAMYGATIGRLGILATDATTNQACCVLAKPRALNVRFVFYWFQCFKQQIIDLYATGGGQPNINQEVVASLRVSAPNLEEQNTIVTFLDVETNKIDALIAEQEKLLKLLAEKRQATISHAVTRGLNPDVPLRDSGAEWLGMVPEHWCAVPLKHLCTLLKDGTHLPPPRVDIGVPLLSVRNIEDSVFSTREDDSMISTDDYDVLCRAFVPAAGDVLMAIVGATLGKVAIIPDGLGNFHLQRSLAIFRPDESLLAKWLFYCISSGTFQRMLWENVGFSAQPGIYLGTLKDFKIPLPSLPEQAEVCGFLDGEVEKLNALKAEATHAIELLNERRSALISAAVTGKIDAREHSSALAAAA